jgi:outer membrane protein insertion porin family
MRVDRAATVLVAAILIAGAAARAGAQVDGYLGKPVTAVRLVSEGKDTVEPALVELVQTKVGRPLSMAQVRETITHLFSLGRFEQVNVDASLAAAGVALRYELVPVHPVTKINFDGQVHAPGVDQGRLRRAVVDRFGLSPLLSRAGEIERTVQDALRARGYLDATVRARYDLGHSPERAILTLTIDAATRTHIGSVDVVGTPTVPKQELLNRLHLTLGAPYEQQALEDRINSYVEDRRKQGYYEAKVQPAARISEADHLAHLTLTVDEGSRVRVVFAGDSLPSDRRADLVPVQREGSADEDLLEDSSNRIEDYLRGLGYRDATAPHTREQKNGELVITFTVKRGPLYRVQRVEISGNSSIALSEMTPSLRLRDGQPFSQARLDADVSTIDGLYRRRGFAGVKVQSALDPAESVPGALQQLIVRISIVEGVRSAVASVRIQGNQSVSEETLRPRLTLEPGQPFYAAQMAVDRDALQLAYADLGYQNATVDAAPRFSADGTQVDLVFTVREGPRLLVDHVLVVGNVRTSQKTIMRALQINPGDPVGVAAVNDAQQRLASLGLFRRARIAALRHGDETTRDLLVTVEEAPPTTIGYGAGGEVRARVVRRAEDGGIAAEKIEFAPRASFQIGRRNLWGKNRSVDLFTSLSLHPRDSPVFANQPPPPAGSGFGFPEYRVQGTFREPRLFDTAADAFITATIEQQIRSSFNFARQSVGAGIARRLSRYVSVTGNYLIQRVRLFDENIQQEDQLDIDRLFPQVRLSSFSSSLIRDTRDDQVDPRTGAYLSANGQLAARAIGSEVGFAKSFFVAQLFRPVPHAGRLVFAGSARLGLANGFPREKVVQTASGGNTVVLIVDDLPQSERFFAGGDTTVRGFALDRLGVQHIPPQPNDTLDKDGFPLGGNALAIFNGELRQPLRWGVSAVGFVDVGQVFAQPTDIDLTALRASAGLGIRWKSPLGPFRIDYGFKLHRQPISLVPPVLESRGQWWFSFGQAF